RRPPVPSFSSRRRRPPTPTLFPYTTLFRSTRRPKGRPTHPPRRPERDQPERSPRQPEHRPRRRRARLQRRGSGWQRRRLRANPPDRKSTRLNSSHVKISYAVFCLKKKKTHT